MTTPQFVITPVNDPIPEAVTKSIHGKNEHPALYTMTTPEGHVYVGSSRNVNARLNKHKVDLKAREHPYPALQAAVAKDQPIQVTVEYMPSRDAALDAEQAFITNNAGSPHLLNKALDARNPGKGQIVSEDRKQKLREFHTGKPLSEETRQKMSEAQKGKVKHGRPVEIEGVVHSSIKSAGEALGVTVLTVRNRINSVNPNFANYSFKEKSKIR